MILAPPDRGARVAVLRTPDDRFVGLPAFPFAPHYVDVVARGVEPVRMAYVDEGPRDAPPVLLLHGQPTWSYLYRHVIAELVGAGLRAIAPDHIGYGRSDKPADPTDYTFRRHVAWIEGFVTALDLTDVTLVVQDWGGPLGLSALARAPQRFARIVAANTILHTCDPDLAGKLEWAAYGIEGDRVVLQESLVDYLLHYQRAPAIVPSLYVDAVSGPLTDEVKAAYDAPFPDPSYTAGLRQMTSLLPLTRNDPGAAIGRSTMELLRGWRKPFLTAYSDGDPATRGWETVFQDQVPGAAGIDHVTIPGAGHFLQETHGPELGQVIASFVAE
jgi:haloalkane dehalogenase